MMEFNPFSSHDQGQRGLPIDPDHDYWRDGKYLVMRQESRLPDRCVCCNASADSKISIPASTEGQRSRIMAVVFLLGMFTDRLTYRYASSSVFSALPRSTSEASSRVRIGLCPEHRQQNERRKYLGRMLNVLAPMLLIGAAIVALFSKPISVMLACLGVLLIGITWLQGTPPTTCHKVEGRFVWLSGVCEEYLEQLPQWTPRR